MTITLSALQKQRYDTAANWTAENPTLLAGEIGVESDTGKIKIGTGSTAWTSLSYSGLIPGSGVYPYSQLLMPSGTAGAPSISFDGDVNTGIYRPAADQLALSTNGAGRLFIDASGNVGVGGNPAYQLHATGTGSVIVTSQGTTDSSFLTNVNGTQGLYVHSTAGLSEINELRNLPLTFSTNATERLRITSAGLVGIGTSSPSQLLHVNGNALVGGAPAAQWSTFTVAGDSALQAASPIFNFVNAAGSARFAYINHTGTGGDLYLLNQEAGALRLGAGNAERLRITSAGLVGIGSSSPGSLLNLSGTFGTSLTTGLRIDGLGTTTNNVSPIAFYTQSSNWGTQHAANIACGNVSGTDGGGYLRFSAAVDGSAAPVERMRLTSTGLGIGTTSPADTNSFGGTLDLSGSQGGALYVRNQTSASKYGAFGFYDTDIYVTTYATGNIRFNTGSSGTERLRIDSSGRLLVGTSTSIDSDSIIQIKGRPSGAGSVLPSFIGGNTTDLVAGNALCYLSFYDGFRNGRGAYIGVEADASWGANDFPTRLVFSVSQDGSASPTERLRIGNSGRLWWLTSDANGAQFITTSSAGTTNYIFQGFHSGSAIGSAATECYRIFSNGNVQNTNNSYGAISDIKLKENIVDAGPQWDDIKALQVRKYNFKEGQTHTQIGLVAQEVELISPGLVSESPDRDEEGNDLGTVTKSVNYSVLYMKAVKALQEAMERIETLEAKVAALESA